MPHHRRLAWLLAAGATACLAASAYRHYWLALPMGTGPAGPAVAREPFARTWNEGQVFLLGLGDAVTEGGNAPYTRSSFRRLARSEHDDTPDMLGVDLSRVYPHLRFYNRAVSGATSAHLLTHQARLLPRQNQDIFGIVVLTAGSNDLFLDQGKGPDGSGLFGASVDECRASITAFEGRLTATVDLIAQRFPGGCAVFVGNVADPTDGVGDTSSLGLPAWPGVLTVLAELNRAIRRIAETRSHVHVVDLHAAFLGHGVHCAKFWSPHYRPEDPHHWYDPTLEGTNDRGADAVRRLFLREIARVLAPR